MRARTRQHRTLAYMRVSTAEQQDSHAGLDAQRAAIEAEAIRRGWTAIDYVEDPAWSGKDLERPAMQRALAMLASGEADYLVAAKVDRISRSVKDYAGLLERAHREGWHLVTLDLGIDTSTPMGEAMANVSATFAQLERRMIGQRTADALAQKRITGTAKGKKDIGRPLTKASREARKTIKRLRAEGMSPEHIAKHLNDQGAPTAGDGAQWYASTVRKALASIENRRELVALRSAARD
jgi:DNA invertase Pin-like site-specific DNA recombinase